MSEYAVRNSGDTAAAKYLQVPKGTSGWRRPSLRGPNDNPCRSFRT